MSRRFRPPAPDMAFIRQRTDKDCGVCCLAMLAGLSYEESLGLIFGDEPPRNLSTKTKDIVAAASRSAHAFTTRTRLKVCRSKAWSEVPSNSLVKIRHKGHSNWHWVAYRKGKVYDPARGVSTTNKCGKGPSSYIEICSDSSVGRAQNR